MQLFISHLLYGARQIDSTLTVEQNKLLYSVCAERSFWRNLRMQLPFEPNMIYASIVMDL